jgi:hypothetical protein
MLGGAKAPAVHGPSLVSLIHPEPNAMASKNAAGSTLGGRLSNKAGVFKVPFARCLQKNYSGEEAKKGEVERQQGGRHKHLVRNSQSNVED